ncbi:unnamed protein product [Clavelina lepadiformis]|uniref:Peptidase M24 C-terminal domain-containing protein n=1 Tax=Clavelina lepadiformis TaxID=159417 RepID=A0ABP0GF05_CLALP
MITTSLLTDGQIEYLNEYHSTIRRKLLIEAEIQGKHKLTKWIDSATTLLERSATSFVEIWGNAFVFTLSIISLRLMEMS